MVLTEAPGALIDQRDLYEEKVTERWGEGLVLGRIWTRVAHYLVQLVQVHVMGLQRRIPPGRWSKHQSSYVALINDVCESQDTVGLFLLHNRHNPASL